MSNDPSRNAGPARRIRSGVRRAATAALAVPVLLALAAPAHAQNADPVAEMPPLSLNLSDPAFRSVTDLDGLDSFSIAPLDLPVDAVGSTLFKLDLSDPTCLTGADRCERRSERLSLGVSEYITAKKDDGIDLVLRPRASFRFDDHSSSALVGAVVEIGEDLRRGSDYKTDTWYLFAGADAEALTYAPDSMDRLSSGRFHLQDRIIVGDAQAGVGYRIGDADVSLSYLRREAQAEGVSFNEDAAALSFTWKR
ncbi:hypothetical protein [uncultured Algimonas sp.]|uniref:hypothetical protein n=1 Tax=uncultured Algimonas sp. TaxID=1547920 RepID=UPI00261E946F|nr:hypothetical protein [uncultured Algimonas sp.]